MLLLLLACMPQLHGVDDSGEEACSAYLDADGDGYGSLECAPLTASTVANNNLDCDDDDASVNPGAAELCDGLDQDCDGVADNDPSDAVQRWSDRDGDGFGKPTSPAEVCSDAEGYADNDRDCDDENADVNPDGAEICGDELDNDCNGEVDEAGAVDAPMWFEDNDGDGVGAEPYGTSCVAPGSLFSTEKDDCDDADANVFPGQTAWFDQESLNRGWDYDCSGAAEQEYPDYPQCNSSCSGISVPGLVTLDGSIAACGSYGDLATGCEWYSFCSPYGDLNVDPQRCH